MIFEQSFSGDESGRGGDFSLQRSAAKELAYGVDVFSGQRMSPDSQLFINLHNLKEMGKRMKLWNKAKKADFGEVILTWRHRDAGRFGGKIFSWLLGGFVFGILTSILFAALQLPDVALPAARIVFFLVFILGVVNDLFRVILGYEYRITQQAIVSAHPFFGWERVGELLGSANKPFRQTYYYLTWQELQEIREVERGILLVHQNGDEIKVPVHNVIKLVMNLNLNKPEPKGSSKSDKQAYDKAVLRIISQAAREARRSIVNAKKDH
ncbi:hypothetical protein JW998_01045 [candidate division KSB1 bacterium]|nr:hypothetical protein [candidate division KSB1 bacterium]